ncbi:MAG TPA: hypothetical protein DEA08_33060 [Planctomycetes bacterium]|nr:hypothetical protein [Planctomycetota bacterium]|tara:strand:- start:315 stop:1409 length:1095 start_codon:yes stop_codon:yes gene_type:complete
MKNAAATPYLLFMLVFSFASSVAAADEEQEIQGETLAAKIEATENESVRKLLLEDVDKLSPKQQSKLVGYARKLREEGKGWKHLAPALAKVGTKTAVLEIVYPLTVPKDGYDDGYGKVVLPYLAELHPRYVMPPLVEGLAIRSRSVWKRLQPVLEGLVLQGKSTRTFRALFYAIDDYNNKLERDYGRRERELVYDRLWSVISRAAQQLDEKAFREFRRSISLRRAPASVAFGLAHGVRKRLETLFEQRVAETRKRLELTDEEKLTVDELDEIKDGLPHEDLLYVLAQREESNIRVEAFRGAKIKLTVLDEDWFGVLYAGLAASNPRGERDAAWAALKTVSNVNLRQNQITWKQWWDQQKQGAAE